MFRAPGSALRKPATSTADPRMYGVGAVSAYTPRHMAGKKKPGAGDVRAETYLHKEARTACLG